MRTPTTGRGLHPKIEADSVHLWPFDDVALGATTQDLVAGAAGALTAPGGGQDPSVVPGNIGNALAFDVFGNFLTGPTGDDALLNGAWTVEAWVYVPQLLVTGGGPVVSYSTIPPTGVPADNELLSLAVDAAGTVTVSYQLGPGATKTLTSSAKIRFAQWQHIAITKTANGPDFDIAFWFNGAKVNESLTVAASTGGANSLWRVGTDASGAYFLGSISSIHFASSVLSDAEILANFQRGMSWAPARSDHRLKVLIGQNDPQLLNPSPPINMSDFRGRDWVIDCEISDTIDSATQTATVRLVRNSYDEAISPLMKISPENLVDVVPPVSERPSPAHPGPDTLTFSPVVDLYRSITVYAARVPSDMDEPEASDWQLIFDGRIDSINWASDAMELRCRDITSDLIDFFIRTQGGEFGSAGGTPIETVMNDILLVHAPLLFVYAPVSPGFLINTYQQRAEPIADALKTMADLIGWSLRYRWDEDNLAFILTLYDPDRDSETFDAVIGAGDYSAVSRMGQDLTGVRNVITISFEDDNGAKQSIFRQAFQVPPYTSDSVSRYGSRWISIAEKATIHINNEVEAEAMAFAILSDLMEPFATKSVSMFGAWEIGIGDRLRFEPNNIHYSEALEGAVVGVRHLFQGNRCESTITLRGRPASGHFRHLEKGGSNRVGSYIAPGSAAETLTDVGPRMRSIPFESFGALGLGSHLVSDAIVATPNPYFSTHVDYDNRCFDGWSPSSGFSWGAAADVYWDAGTQESGDRSLTLLTTGAMVESTVYQAAISTRCYRLSARWTGADAADELRGEILWYDAARVFISASQPFQDVVRLIGAFQTSRGVSAPPTNARFARVRLSQQSLAAVPGPLTIDRALLIAVMPSFSAHLPADQTGIAAGAVEIVELDDTSSTDFDYCGDFSAVTFAYTAPESGRYVFAGKTLLAAQSGLISDGEVYLYKNGAPWLTVSELDIVGGANFLALPFQASAQLLEDGDEITLRVRCVGVAFNILSGTQRSFLTGNLVVRRYG
jgi:hypothetical protein